MREDHVLDRCARSRLCWWVSGNPGRMDEQPIVIFDVDGTLVDTNYHHALAWSQAFRDRDVAVPVWRIHRAIGMGGDRLVSHVAGQQVEDQLGDALRDDWKKRYEAMIDEVVPFEGARDALATVKRRGWRAALASSGDPDHVRHYLRLLDVDGLADDWTSASDAPSTKPAPDLLRAALRRVGEGRAVLIGDSTWDCLAAENAGLLCVALRTGGFGAAELREAGAVRVLDTLIELHHMIPELPFARPRFQQPG